MCIIASAYVTFVDGFKGWATMIVRDGWKYFILASCDVEGNFLVVKVITGRTFETTLY